MHAVFKLAFDSEADAKKTVETIRSDGLSTELDGSNVVVRTAATAASLRHTETRLDDLAMSAGGFLDTTWTDDGAAESAADARAFVRSGTRHNLPRHSRHEISHLASQLENAVAEVRHLAARVEELESAIKSAQRALARARRAR